MEEDVGYRTYRLFSDQPEIEVTDEEELTDANPNT
jgi:hypothetical protein